MAEPTSKLLIADRQRLTRAGLVGVLLLAAFLRFWGVRFGLPYFEHPDEWAVADEALRMLRTGNISPLSFTYPTLYVYMQVGVAWLHYLWGASIGIYHSVAEIDPARFYVWARALTASLGTAAVGLTYLLARRLYGPIAGLLAACFLAVLPTAVGDAHYVTVDTPAMFFTLLALLAITRFIKPVETQDIAGAVGIAGIAVGLAASTKYNAGVLVVPLLVAIGLAIRDRMREQRTLPAKTLFPLRLLITLLVAAGLGVAIGFTLGTPLWFAERGRVFDDLASIARHYRETGHPGAESSRPALFYYGALSFEAPVLAWVALAGALLAVVRRRRADLLLLAFVLPYVLQLSSVRVVFFRNAVPLLPALCVLAAAAVVALVRELSKRQKQASQSSAINRQALVLLIVALTVITAQPLAKALRDEWLRAQPTTRILATEWVLRHASAGTRIWLEDQTLILPQRLRVQGGQPVTSHPLAWYTEHGFRYLVVNASIAKSDKASLALFGEPVARFEANGQRYGHTFLIYDTGIGDIAQEPRTPSGATLGGGAVVLDGYRHPDASAAGSVLPLALYWRVEREPGHDYTVFVHLLDAQGNKLAQRDLPPLDGSRPTSGWRVGEIIRDDQDLTIPATVPPGRYQIVVGMYDSQTFVAITDNGPIAVGEVEVK